MSNSLELKQQGAIARILNFVMIDVNNVVYEVVGDVIRDVVRDVVRRKEKSS